MILGIIISYKNKLLSNIHYYTIISVKLARIQVEVFGPDVQFVESTELRIFELGSQTGDVVQSPYLVLPERPLEQVQFNLVKKVTKDELVTTLFS